ncbi:hypothetical protein [Halobacillus sp. Marseille-Q1614]|uniref:hypothetical protein n=1 Tax=Halobacillus sp. Marseille-Q1614 TaxID=2709134 RepID=UPI00156D5EA1|nr:hypothetical protein [Halobacillus sp. Marseille-Q1614]
MSNKSDHNKNKPTQKEIEKEFEKDRFTEDPIPTEDVRQEEQEIKKGEKTKDNSSTEEKYDEDLKNKENNHKEGDD